MTKILMMMVLSTVVSMMVYIDCKVHVLMLRKGGMMF